MNQWVFVELDCEPQSENGQRPFPDDAVSWRRTVLLAKTTSPTHYILPTLQTQVLFFCTKSGKYYDGIDYINIYIYTHFTLLNTVNFCFLSLHLIFFYFLLPETVCLLFLCSSLKTLFSANMNDFQCSSVKEQNNHRVTEDGHIPRGCLRGWDEKGWGILFLSSSVVFITLSVANVFTKKTTPL